MSCNTKGGSGLTAKASDQLEREEVATREQWKWTAVASMANYIDA
ncbi:hypothetical protein GCM10025858_26150 [Alicyclobacillus sacchari]|nr:hypothetical protein GCM10025858_26150 [Alicyclobacillus sacchari]